MICDNPTAVQGVLWSCGQCMPCRFNRRRLWAHRIELEATQHEHNTFLTLTYSDEKLPSSGSLEPADLRNFIKRLRHFHLPEQLRYFAVGEYGEKSWRPHYHAAVFGFRGCEREQTQYDQRGIRCCQRCLDVERIWGYGNIYLGTMDKAASYICGYVVKKMTRRDDPRLQGKYPEFARMSLRPHGIGALAMDDVASEVMQKRLSSEIDITSISYGKSVKPLGHYLTKRLRRLRGLDEKAPQSVLDKVQAELRPLREAARSDKDDPSFRSKFLKQQKGKSASIKARAGLFGKKHETL